jgi:beta-lactamase regulating signal transducer with metallopeptidase domain
MNMGSIVDPIFRFAASTNFLRILTDASLKSALLLGVAGLAVLALRRSGAAVRHLAWSLALGAALAMPLLSGLLPNWELAFLPHVSAPSSWRSDAQRTDATFAVDAPGRQSAGRGVAAESDAPVTPLVTDRSESRATVQISPPEARTAHADLVSPQAVAAPRPRVAPEERGAEWRSTAAAAAPFLASHWGLSIVLVWLIGGAAVVAYLGLGIAGIWWIRRSARPVEPGTLTRLAQALASEIGLRRRITLLRAPGAAMPMTWGFLHPVVLLPSDVHAWPPARQRAVLMHELAHVKRHDYLVQMLAQIACGVYWFNPLVWMAAAQLRIERERACDDQVLCSGSKASDYATQLLEMARSLRPVAVRLAPAVAMAQPSQLSGRLLSILDDKRRHTVLTRRLAVLTWIAVMCISMPLAAIGPKVTKNGAHKPGAATWVQEAPRACAEAAARAAETAAAAQSAISTQTATTVQRQLEAMRAAHAEQMRALEAQIRQQLQQLQDSAARQAQSLRAAQEAQLRALEQSKRALEQSQQVQQRQAETLAAARYAEAQALARAESDRLATADASPSGRSRGSRTSASIHEDDGHLRMRVTGDGVDIKAEGEGKIEFNADHTDVAKISRDGYFEIADKSDGTRRRFEITARPDGGLDRRCWVDGKEHAYDAEAKRWLAQTLTTLFRRTGYDAEARAKHILEREGVPGLLREIDQISSNYARRQYYGVLLAQGSLDPATVQSVVQQAGGEIDSDYELAELLIQTCSKYTLNAAARSAYVKAANTLQSDYEHRRVLSAMLKQGAPEPEVTKALLRSATAIGSDYELAELLIEVLNQQPPDGALFPEFLAAADGLGSDYEHGRVLSTLLERRDLEKPVLLSVLTSAAHIGSEHERAEVLVRLVEKQGVDPELRQPFLDAAHTLESEYQRGRVLSAASDHGL